MLWYDKNIRFSFFCADLPEGQQLVEVPPYKGYNEGNGDIFERNPDGHYFEINKASKLEFAGAVPHGYLRKVIVLYGVRPDVRLIVEAKNDRRMPEDWMTITNVGVDLTTLDFNDYELSVKLSVEVGGIIRLIESRFDDEYDIMPNKSVDEIPLSPLKTVEIALTPREIKRRSRLVVEDGTEVAHPASGGDGLSARAIPFRYEYSSDPENINNVLGNQLSAAGGTYADLSDDKTSNLFFLNADRLRVIKIFGKIKTTQSGNPWPGSFHLDLIRYDGGLDFNFAGIIQRFDSADPAVTGDVAEVVIAKENPLVVVVQPGESLAFSTIADVIDGIRYRITETIIDIEEEDLYPATNTKAIKPFDLFSRLVAKITGKEGVFDSTIFGPGGKYENVLLAHGTWLRNMPEIINEGKEDEKAVQANISLKKLYEGFGILEPLAYKKKLVGLNEVFVIRSEKETQTNEVLVRIGEDRGSGIELTQVQKVERKVIGENYWGSINIGSTTSGSSYGEVNNLYSTCGNAKWNTINNKSKSKYEALTELRTGPEDIEIQRQKQWADKPDFDAEFDNDWFLIDCAPAGAGKYVLKRWQDYYETKPDKVYSADTNYNWIFTPARLLLGHGWKLKAGFSQAKYASDSVKFISSNCDSSLITKKTGQIAIGENQPIPHSVIENATIKPMDVEFSHPINQEIYEQLINEDNLDGLIEFLSSDGVEYARLIKCDTNNEGKWDLVEAKIN